MLLHFQYCMSNILINIIISSFKKEKIPKHVQFTNVYIYESDNAITFKHQCVLLFWYLDNFLVKDQTGLPL